MKKYYTLLCRDKEGEPWRIEFGSYDRGEVIFERACYHEQGNKMRNLKIITTRSDTSAIEAYVASLNGREVVS